MAPESRWRCFSISPLFAEPGWYCTAVFESVHFGPFSDRDRAESKIREWLDEHEPDDSGYHGSDSP